MCSCHRGSSPGAQDAAQHKKSLKSGFLSSWNERFPICVLSDLDSQQEYSITVLFPYWPWVSTLLSQTVSIEGSYCTASPINTHTEVPLSQANYALFRSMRRHATRSQIKLCSQPPAWKTGSRWPFLGPGIFVSCRFTTCRVKNKRTNKLTCSMTKRLPR